MMPAVLKELRLTLALALPMIMGQVSQMLIGLTDNAFIGRVGTVELAAAAFTHCIFSMFYIAGIGLLLPVGVFTAREHGVGNDVGCATLTFMVPLGLSMATSIRISKALGGGRRDTLRAIGFGALGASGGIMHVFAVVFMTAGTLLARGFTADAAMITLAAQLFGIAALFQLFDGTQVVAAGALRGLTDVKVPTVITFVAYWMVCCRSAMCWPITPGWDHPASGSGWRAASRAPQCC